jgi:glycosyltransferase involved in cell wall biosynthesis
MKELSRKHKITLLAFSDDSELDETQSVLKKFCERILIIRHERLIANRNLASHIFTSLPFQCAYYLSRKMRDHLIRECSKGKYDILHVQLSRMMPYVTQRGNIPIFVDFVDALSLNMRKRLDRERLFLKPLFFCEWYKMKRYEVNLEPFFDGAIISSPFDRKILPYAHKIKVLPNGVDLDFFQLSPTAQREPDTIIFTGNMNYFPNIDAVIFFSRYIYPTIKKIIPQVKFKIVGANPAPVVSKLSTPDRSIEVIGSVESIVNHIAKAAIAVAPMLSGSGIQNKVLEAMAVGIPVVATDMAIRAIDAKPGRDLLVANDPSKFAEAVTKLLTDSTFRHNL